MNKPKKKSKGTTKPRSKRPPSGEDGGSVRRRRGRLLFAGALAGAAATAVLVLILLPKSPKDLRTPEEADARSPRVKQGSLAGELSEGAGAAEAESLATDEALKQETFDVVNRLIADFPGNAFAVGLMGTVHSNYGNSTEAEKWWLECLEMDPGRSDVYSVLGTAAMRSGEYEKVAELLRKAQTINPNMPGVHGRYAEALLEMGEVDEALEAAMKETEISPTQIGAHILLGKIYLQRGEYQNALAAYTTARQLRPYDSRPYYGLATACARLGQSDKAKEFMETFTKLRNEEDKTLTTQRRASNKPPVAAKILAETLIDAGRVYSEYRQFPKAEEYWLRAAVLDPANTVCRVRLVELYRRAQRGPEALDVCEQLIEIDPRNASYHLSTASLLAQLQRFDAAEEAVRKAIERAPGNAAGYRTLAEILLRSNRKLPEAKALAEKLVEMEPTLRHYLLLGTACSRTNDRDGALAAMKRAVELAPNNEDIREAYEKLQEGR
jgi:tetratricopeptide (TPR) repeat protein